MFRVDLEMHQDHESWKLFMALFLHYLTTDLSAVPVILVYKLAHKL
jgi:hypothetical protein